MTGSTGKHLGTARMRVRPNSVILSALFILFLSSSASAQNNGDDLLTAFFADHRTEIEKIADDPALMKGYVSAQKDVNTRYKNGQTLLHFAANRGYVDTVALLLQKGAGINAQDDDGRTPLHEAMSYSRFPVVKLLLDKGADANLKNKDGETPLFSIIFLDHKKTALDLVNLFLAKGFDATRSADARLLNETIGRRHPEVALILLSNGTPFDDGALSGAARMGYENVFQALLQRGANPAQKGVLRSACDAGNLNIIKILVKKGQEPTPEDIDFALYKGHAEAASYLNARLKEKSGRGVEMQRRCHLKPADGSCKALFYHGYYDSTTKSCREFVYGGCGGEVPFDTVDACRSVCEEIDKGR